jgi:hypothetical protein
MYVCMCVCMCVYVCVCVCVCVRTYVCVCMYVCMTGASKVIRTPTLTSPLCQLYLHVLQFRAPPATGLCPSARTVGLFAIPVRAARYWYSAGGTYRDSVMLFLIK